MAEQVQVIEEVLGGDALTLAAAARKVPAFRPGKPTNSSTIWRWANKGIRIPGGRVVKLEVCRLGGRQVTSLAALKRFIQAQTPSSESSAVPMPAPPTPTRRKRRSDQANQELDRLGI